MPRRTVLLGATACALPQGKLEAALAKIMLLEDEIKAMEEAAATTKTRETKCSAQLALYQTEIEELRKRLALEIQHRLAGEAAHMECVVLSFHG